MLLRVILPLLLLAQPVPSDLPKVFKDANDFMMGVAEKMPMWDADKLGQFERREIQLVKDDILDAEVETDPDNFLIDIQRLHNDVDALQALDEALNIEHVI